MSPSSGTSSTSLPWPMARSLSSRQSSHNASASARAPAPPSQSRSRKTQQHQHKELTIIPYCPDPAKRKAARRDNQQAGSSRTASEDSASAVVKLEDIPPLPLERISSSRSWDPFNALAVLYVSKEERFMLNYAYTTSWAVWGDRVTGTNNFAQAWMARSMESSATFYSQIVGAAAHYEIARRTIPIESQRLSSVRLRAKSKTMERLRQEIYRYNRSPSAVPFDCLLMAIFALAVHDNIDLSSPDHDHGLSQLAKIRDMHIYGRVVFGEEHMSAMYQLVEQRGGLDKVDESAFGKVIPLLDMMYAARTQRSPRLPCTQTLRPLRVPTVWQPDERAEKLLKIIGSSFRDYTERPSSVLQLENRFSMLLGTLSELCAALDHSQRLGMKVFEDPHVFIGNCDWVSHSLLSMPSFLAENNEKSGEDGGEANSSSSPSLDATLSEICRLGALMYIDMAIYPTPPQAGVKNKLSQLLFPLLRSLVETESLEGHSLVADLVLWGTMMGAISARSTELQDSYIDFIADNRIGRLRSWEEIGPRLLSFLWLNSVFDELARQLWHQAEQIAEPAEDG